MPPRVITECDSAAIGHRWIARFEGDDRDDAAIGFGHTKDEAIADLRKQGFSEPQGERT